MHWYLALYGTYEMFGSKHLCIRRNIRRKCCIQSVCRVKTLISLLGYIRVQLPGRRPAH